jgi:hypothetical protein
MSPKSRWGLRRVTAHVSWPIQLLNRLAFVPAFFHWMEEGAPHWVNRDKELLSNQNPPVRPLLPPVKPNWPQRVKNAGAFLDAWEATATCSSLGARAPAVH